MACLDWVWRVCVTLFPAFVSRLMSVCPFCAITQVCTREGFLMKQTSSFQRWRRRYFKLKGRTLYYAKDTKVRTHTVVYKFILSVGRQRKGEFESSSIARSTTTTFLSPCRRFHSFLLTRQSSIWIPPSFLSLSLLFIFALFAEILARGRLLSNPLNRE